MIINTPYALLLGWHPYLYLGRITLLYSLATTNEYGDEEFGQHVKIPGKITEDVLINKP